MGPVSRCTRGPQERDEPADPAPAGLAHVASARPFLVIAGDGPRLDDLVALLDRMGLSGDARVLGYVPEPEALLVAADMLVLLSRAEGMPRRCCRRPPQGPRLCCEVDGVDELLDLGVAGFVVDQGDVVGAARAVAGWINGAALQPAPRPCPTAELRSWQGRRRPGLHDADLVRARPPVRSTMTAVAAAIRERGRRRRPHPRGPSRHWPSDSSRPGSACPGPAGTPSPTFSSAPSSCSPPWRWRRVATDRGRSSLPCFSRSCLFSPAA